MSHPQPFDETHAATYDQRFAKLVPLRDALHLVTRLALHGVPAEARILCVGAGTGAEILYLGEAFPGWRFTAVDPSKPMLDRCRSRTEAAGMAERCDFHDGTLDSFPGGAVYDAATSLLVSQFVVDPDARREFFRAIARRLRPNAPLVTADLAAVGGEDLLAIWREAWLYSGVPAENVARMSEMIGKQVAVSAPDEIAALIAGAGFGAPIQCLQTLLIHAWLARRIS